MVQEFLYLHETRISALHRLKNKSRKFLSKSEIGQDGASHQTDNGVDIGVKPSEATKNLGSRGPEENF